MSLSHATPARETQARANQARATQARATQARAGFTLVELLIVMAIIAVLVAMLVPAIMYARELANQARCQSNLRQIALAMNAYEARYKTFPPAEIHNNGASATPNHCQWDQQVGSWLNFILPDIDQKAAYDMLNFNVRPQYNDPNNVTVMQMPFDLYFCPSDNYRGLTTQWGGGGDKNRARIVHYYAVSGSVDASTLKHPDGTDHKSQDSHCNANDGLFYNDSMFGHGDIGDGSSHQVLVTETWGRLTANHDETAGESSRGMNLHAVVYFDWTPNLYADPLLKRKTSPWKASSFHPGGVFVVWADSSTRFISDQVNLTVWKAFSTRSAMDTPSDNAY